MRLVTVVDGYRREVGAVEVEPGRLVPVSAVAPDLPPDLQGLLDHGLTDAVRARLADGAQAGVASASQREATAQPPLLRRPRKVIGIGLNYREHADDLSAPFPTSPASFLKADHTIIGGGEPIVIPAQSKRTTAEAELGIVIGRECWQVDEANALDYVAGFCLILDQTAEDILHENPRFLTRSKNFPTFLSLGDTLVTTDEVLDRFGDLDRVRVATVHNGEVARENAVAAMEFGPRYLVSFHSQVMPLYPGDIISSGTPGAVPIAPGDVVTCRIEGLGELTNPVAAGSPGAS